MHGDRTGRFGTEFNEMRIVAGRRADPAVADEVVLSKSTADRLGIGPGTVLQLSPFDSDDCFEPSAWDPPIELRVVGVGVSPGEVPPPSGEYFASVQVTPAFLVEHAPVPTRELAVPIRLRPAADEETLLADIAGIGGQAQVFFDARDQSEAVDRGIRPQAVTLALVAGLAALAGAAIVGQTLVRQSRSDAVDRSTLTALGMSRRGHLAVGLLAAAFIGVVAGACALLVALAVSTLTPVGLAGEIEPDPGVSVDRAVMGIGAVATVAFVFAVMAVCAWWPSQAIDRRRTARRCPVPFVDGMAHAGLPTTMVSGVRMALERGAGRDAVPVGTSIAAIAVATLAIVGSLTFGAGIDHLVETPRLIGLNWDGLLLMPSVGDEEVEPAQIDSALREHPDVAAFTPGTFFAPFPGEEEFNDNLQLGAQRLDVAVLSFGSTVDIGPSVITGRAPMAADEVLIAPETLAELGLALGDTVEGYGQADPMPLRIVGIGVIPNTGGQGRLGRGASLTLDGVTRLNADTSADGFWLRFADGADPGTVLGDVLERVGARPINQGSDFFPAGAFGTALVLGDVEQVDRAPTLFAAIMAVMALGVIVHVLVDAMHANRRDLAALRAIGLRRRDVGTRSRLAVNRLRTGGSRRRSATRDRRRPQHLADLRRATRRRAGAGRPVVQRRRRRCCVTDHRRRHLVDAQPASDGEGPGRHAENGVTVRTHITEGRHRRCGGSTTCPARVGRRLPLIHRLFLAARKIPTRGRCTATCSTSAGRRAMKRSGVATGASANVRPERVATGAAKPAPRPSASMCHSSCSRSRALRHGTPWAEPHRSTGRAFAAARGLRSITPAEVLATCARGIEAHRTTATRGIRKRRR